MKIALIMMTAAALALGAILQPAMASDDDGDNDCRRKTPRPTATARVVTATPQIVRVVTATPEPTQRPHKPRPTRTPAVVIVTATSVPPTVIVPPAELRPPDTGSAGLKDDDDDCRDRDDDHDEDDDD